MKTLFFGAGPLGTVYAHLLHEAGGDVTMLARGERHDWIKENGLVLQNEITGEEGSSRVNVVDELVRMIRLHRSFDAMTRAISNSDEARSQLVGMAMRA